MVGDTNSKVDLTLEPADFPYSKQIEQILEYFDDLRVANIMDAEGMQWAVCDQKSGSGMLETPTRSMIRNQARLMLEHCAMTPGDTYLSGASLLVIKFGERLGLYFIPACSDTFGDL
jgi:hypothetical protein